MPTIQSINPYTQELNAEFELLTDAEIIAKIELAHQAYWEWKVTPKSEKKRLFLSLADTIESNLEEMAKLQTIEMGMLYTNSVNWLKLTVSLIRWFADNFERILADEEFEEEGTKGKYQYDSLGVIFGVAPWNFPYNQVLRAAIPNILAGNTQVYKHASNVPLCAQKIEDIFRKAGFREGIYTNLFASSKQSELIMSHPHIRGTNLTWGEGAGRSIGSLAGKNLIPSVLELGGNDAFIVLDTNNLESIATAAVRNRTGNGGQRCNSSKRFIVLEKYYDEFCALVSKKMATLKMGDPMDPTTELQPLAKSDLVDEVERQVKKTIQEWAICLTGGTRVEGKGNFFAPTVLAGVTNQMTSFKEEVFGPVATIIKSTSIEDSIRLANDCDFWLCGCVYGDDMEACKQVAEQIETGMIFINAPAASRASLPFGWVKKSWYGKENWAEGLKSFTNKKVIVY